MIPDLDWFLVGAWVTAVFSLLAPILAVVAGISLAVYLYASVLGAVSRTQEGEVGFEDDEED